ncbi:MAG: sce7726 family protein [Lachnospiraceae bacterium]|nr:sce7726 family protein [Lachnospiraceae bacterium]
MLKDSDIREPLFDFLENTYGKIRIIEEKTMGRSRADIVMVTPEELYGIEIKSDADTYGRLESQVRDYDRFFDRNIAVVGTSHAMHIHEHIPEHWGIITVEAGDPKPDFYFLRRPGKNPEMDWEKKLSVLWKPELAQIQEWNGMPKYKEKSRQFVARKIAERIPDRIREDTLRGQVSGILFERDYSTVDETLREYRKGEIQKQLEAEEDPEKRLLLMTEQAARGRLLSRNGFRKARKKRKRTLNL